MMRTITSRSAGLAHSNKALQKPTVLTLLGHILKSAFGGEVLWITAPGGALLAYLHVNKFATANLLVLLLGAVVILAFLRGCKEWQNDLNRYHKDLLHQRNSQSG